MGDNKDIEPSGHIRSAAHMGPQQLQWYEQTQAQLGEGAGHEISPLARSRWQWLAAGEGAVVFSECSPQ